MTKQQATSQSLASCGAFHIGFIGLAHEFLGPMLSPWAPPAFGVLWHPAGLSVVALGMLLLAGTLRVIRIPVVPLALFAAAAGVAAVILIASLYHQFHFLSLSMAIAGVLTAIFHRKAEQISR